MIRQLESSEIEAFLHHAEKHARESGDGRLGFAEVGRAPDRYRLDGLSIEDVRLSLRLDV